ncbi:MAG: 4Fe-4S dicluster domain-containing protein [Candidatus Thorarchaeota archaeon]|nr:4Fe-4S dicluster domain-containing protein [Candidatus Thorarchaeota archaeon]
MRDDLENKLGLLKYRFDEEAHIVVDKEECSSCESKPCIPSCPAGCFKLEDGELTFQYEDCIECGTCKIICPYDVVDWSYPRGGFGVVFRHG